MEERGRTAEGKECQRAGGEWRKGWEGSFGKQGAVENLEESSEGTRRERHCAGESERRKRGKMVGDLGEGVKGERGKREREETGGLSPVLCSCGEKSTSQYTSHGFWRAP